MQQPLKTLHAPVERNGEFRGGLMDSITSMKLLLTDIAKRQELKESLLFIAAPQYELDLL